VATNDRVDSVNELLSSASAKKYRGNIARRLGIDHFIRRNPRQGKGPLPTTVSSLAISAIVGAAWFDSDGDLHIVREVMRRLQSVSPNTILECSADNAFVPNQYLRESRFML